MYRLVRAHDWRPCCPVAAVPGEETIGMQITCPKCKEAQEVDDKTATCPACRSVLRRCMDCDHYDTRLSYCTTLSRPVDVGEANYPTFSSDSTYCREYIPGSAEA